MDDGADNITEIAEEVLNIENLDVDGFDVAAQIAFGVCEEEISRRLNAD